MLISLVCIFSCGLLRVAIKRHRLAVTLQVRAASPDSPREVLSQLLWVYAPKWKLPDLQEKVKYNPSILLLYRTDKTQYVHA